MASQPKSFFLTPELHAYLVAHSTPPDEVADWLVAETTAQAGSSISMQISPEQGTFMTLLTAALGAVNAVEVGTFTGYSSLCIARGLAVGGRLLCCDISEKWTAIARQAWSRAEIDDRIDLVIAPALATLRSLPQEETIDLAFIDADKESYSDYYEELLLRMRPNGVLLVDNTLWSGAVLDSNDSEADTQAIRAFNKKLATDDRVDVALLTIGDGLTMVRKRS